MVNCRSFDGKLGIPKGHIWHCRSFVRNASDLIASPLMRSCPQKLDIPRQGKPEKGCWGGLCLKVQFKNSRASGTSGVCNSERVLGGLDGPGR